MSASVISAVNLGAARVNATRRRATTSSSASQFIKGGLPSYEYLRVRDGKCPASSVMTLRRARAPTAVAPRAQMNADPRNSPIARIAAGIEDPTGAVPTKKQLFNLSEAWNAIWKMRKGIAGVALAVVLALADAAPAMAGRGGGRSGGRMGGSSFRPSSSRSMVGHRSLAL